MNEKHLNRGAFLYSLDSVRESEPPRADLIYAKLKSDAPHVLCSCVATTRDSDSVELA